MRSGAILSRRALLKNGGLVVSFALAPKALAQLAGGGEGGAGPTAIAPNLPGSLKSTPWLDSWIRIDAEGRITVFTGKAELGQGIKTALLQVAAEELDVPPTHIAMVTADTARTPDEGLTAGSHSMQDSGTAIRNAAANVRMLLIRAAAARWNTSPENVATDGEGRLRSGDGAILGYAEIAASMAMHVEAIPNAPLRQPGQFKTMGTALPRLDIGAKVTGGPAYVHDMRLPGMLHARVLRGPSAGTRFDVSNDVALDGARIVRAGSFVAVVAEREWTAITALRKLQDSRFTRVASPIPLGDVADVLKSMPSREIVVLDTHDAVKPAAKTVKARYSRPWISHGSIGPSCALALYQDDLMTIWSHSQGVFDVRRVAADLLGLPIEKVHAIHVEGAGCYGQNGADDVAAEAALIAKSAPGRPIRLQWMREQEFGWEPLGPGMATEVEASIDGDGRIVAWNYQVWSNPHNNRPVNAGGVLAGAEVAPPFPAPEGKPIPMPEGDGDRNANPLYVLPNMHVIYHFIKDMPIRVSALRSLGAHLNVFSIESMLDELAKAGGLDPLAFRLAHMQDERARAVMIKAADAFGWAARARGDGRRGCGMGFARYKNIGAYCALAMEVEVERQSGRIAVLRVSAAADCGQPVNPDGIRNQVEGGIIQSLSWTSLESMTFDTTHRTGFDWSSYPIYRFSDVPEALDVHVMESPGLPFLGVAECAQGPTAAALANAVADALGVRLRDMPLSPERVRQALGGS